VVRTIVELDRDTVHLEASEDSTVHRLFCTFFNCWDEFAWDNTTLDVVDEFKVVAVTLYVLCQDLP
jgi:hypothetical protein